MMHPNHKSHAGGLGFSAPAATDRFHFFSFEGKKEKKTIAYLKPNLTVAVTLVLTVIFTYELKMKLINAFWIVRNIPLEHRMETSGFHLSDLKMD